MYMEANHGTKAIAIRHVRHALLFNVACMTQSYHLRPNGLLGLSAWSISRAADETIIGASATNQPLRPEYLVWNLRLY